MPTKTAKNRARAQRRRSLLGAVRDRFAQRAAGQRSSSAPETSHGPTRPEVATRPRD